MSVAADSDFVITGTGRGDGGIGKRFALRIGGTESNIAVHGDVYPRGISEGVAAGIGVGDVMAG